MIRNLLFCFFLIASIACASAIVTTSIICDLPGCSADAGPYFASVVAMPPSPPSGNYGFGHFLWVSASFEDTFIFTVTSGPEQGFVASCYTASADTYQGSDSVSGSFVGGGAPPPTERAFF